MKVESSSYLSSMRPSLEKLLSLLLGQYAYASILAADVEMKSYSVGRPGIRIAENHQFGRAGYTVRVYKDGGYAEYSADFPLPEDPGLILAELNKKLDPLAERFERFDTPLKEESPLSFVRSTDFELDPRELGDEEIVRRLTAARERGMEMDKELLDCFVRFNYQVYHKLFLSEKRSLEQNVMFSDAAAFCRARKGDAVKDGYSPVSVLGGAEVLDRLTECAKEACEAVRASVAAEPIV